MTSDAAGAVLPCRFCVANWSGMTGRLGGAAVLPTSQDCADAHRDDVRVYGLARALAKVFQSRAPSDEQVAWFLGSADQVVDGFDPAPPRWRVRRLPASANDGEYGIEARVRINDITYVILEGSRDCEGGVLPLATFRAQLGAAG